MDTTITQHNIMGERVENVYLAKLAEQAERYDEMVDAMKRVAHLNVQLTAEERNLLSVAYKNVIGARRASWRIISSIEQKEKCNGNNNNVEIIKKYAYKINTELNDIVKDVLKVIDEHLIPHASGSDSKVFYYKMKGDYYRYKTEFTVESVRAEAVQQSSEAYQKAWLEIEESTQPTDPIRLGMALSFSMFYYEIVCDPSKACDLAKKAFDDAIAKLDDLSEDSYITCTVLMQQLRDNLTLWTSCYDDHEGKD